jgi:4-amino-4-deoxy-L-arabinose transferase-like glycosyltransferase
MPGGRRELWVLALIVAAGAAIRFATLDLQSFRHDEAVTAGRVLRDGLGGTIDQVSASESSPPLYYLLAWAWSKAFGVGEVGLRALSALLGTAAIAVAYLAVASLVSRRAGLIAAALFAFNPILVWYSQDARPYAPLILFSCLSFLFFVRVMRDGEHGAGKHLGQGWDLFWWAVSSALALASHYFALFLIIPEGAILLWRVADRRAVAAAAAGVAAAGTALLPLALDQASANRNDWIARRDLLDRVAETGKKFLIGETGGFKYAIVPLALVLIGVGMAALTRGRERRAVRLALAVGSAAIAIPCLLAVFDQDYVLARNLLPALLPLTAVVAAGFAVGRPAWLGIAAATALAVFFLAFDIYVDRHRSLQRPDWRAAAEVIGPANESRLIVAPPTSDDALRYYLHEPRARRVRRATPRVAEIVVLGYGPPAETTSLPRAFRRSGEREAGYFTVTLFRAEGPRSAPVAKLTDGALVGAPSAAVLLDGVAP